MKFCSSCHCVNPDNAVCCRKCGGVDFKQADDSALALLAESGRRRVAAVWCAVGILGLGCFFLRSVPWSERLCMFLFFESAMAGWFLLILYAQKKARGNSAAAEEFRTGGVPLWRLVLYALIAIAGVAYFIYPQWRDTKINAFQFAFVLAIPCGMIAFFAGLPHLAKRMKSGPRR